MSFSKDQIYCVIDFETFSEMNLRKCGSWEYSLHPTTEILCAAFKIGTRETLKLAPTYTWAPGDSENKHFGKLYLAMISLDVIMVAHNALFEQAIAYNVFATKVMYSKEKDIKAALSPERWICTAALASALSLPRSLEGAALALNLPIKKDMGGRHLINKWCKPRKPSKNNPKTRHDDPEEFARIVQYCATDVDVETELFLKTRPLTKLERQVWILDQKINLRGFMVDRRLVATCLELIDEETININQKTRVITDGAITTTKQVAATSKWLSENGVFLPNMQKQTVEDAIKNGLAKGDAKKILQYRLAISKTSTAKYQAFWMRSASDGRLRDNLVYHAASTGRWGGAGVQPQNLPRPTLKDTDYAASVILESDLETIRMLYGEPMSVFSNCVRSAIIASPGKVLDVADYAAIEARVLFWVARHEDGLDAFRSGRDLYIEQASKTFRIPAKDIAKDSFERFIGKGLILGCGYQLGAKKFVEACAKGGQVITEEFAKSAVDSYRSTNKPVVKLWSNIQRAAQSAVDNVGKTYSVNRTSWFVKGRYLFCELPSGRRLAYYSPKVLHVKNRWGVKQAVLTHMGVNSLTKKWMREKTYGGKLVENIVQAISRDLMAEAMLRIEKTGTWNIVLSVHDELIAERSAMAVNKKESTEEFCKLMSTLPTWADGLPVSVEGWCGMRYKK